MRSGQVARLRRYSGLAVGCCRYKPASITVWIASGPQVTECCDAADRIGDGAAADVEASWLAHAVANAVASAVTNHATDRWSTRSITPPPVFRVSGGEGAST